MTDTHGTPTPGQVPPLPNTPAVRRALDEIATAVAADVAATYERFLASQPNAAVTGFALCTVDDAIPPYAMGAVQEDFTLPSGPEAKSAELDIHPPNWSWTDPGGSFASGDIIDRILNSDEVIPEDPDDELKAWQLRSSVCLRGMVEGLKRFEERGGFTSSVPREQRLLLLWVNDSEHPEWMCEWAAELNPSTAAESFAHTF